MIKYYTIVYIRLLMSLLFSSFYWFLIFSVFTFQCSFLLDTALLCSTFLYLLKIWQPPIFPGRLQPSIFGRLVLDYRVRYGNEYCHRSYRHQKLYDKTFIFSEKVRHSSTRFARSTTSTTSLPRSSFLLFHLNIKVLIYKLCLNILIMFLTYYILIYETTIS